MLSNYAIHLFEYVLECNHFLSNELQMVTIYSATQTARPKKQSGAPRMICHYLLVVMQNLLYVQSQVIDFFCVLQTKTNPISVQKHNFVEAAKCPLKKILANVRAIEPETLLEKLNYAKYIFISMLITKTNASRYSSTSRSNFAGLHNVVPIS